jgi:hypothetical protein
MENKQSDLLDQFLKRLERCGDFGLAAQRADVSNEQFVQWFKDSDASDKIALARYKAQIRKSFRAGLITPEQFAEVLRYWYNCSTKRGSRNDTAIINLLIKNPRISNEDGARKLKIELSAYKMRKKRLIDALFDHITIR